MTQEIAVEYVGCKPSETDHLYGTGIVWVGKGDVQMVPAAAWSRMQKHKDVWCEAAPASANLSQMDSEVQIPVDIAYALSPEHSAALRAEEASVPPEEMATAASDMAQKFAAMTDDEVRAYVKAATGTTLHYRLIGANLRVRALEALPKD
jgi:hypothetical protein